MTDCLNCDNDNHERVTYSEPYYSEKELKTLLKTRKLERLEEIRRKKHNQKIQKKINALKKKFI